MPRPAAHNPAPSFRYPHFEFTPAAELRGLSLQHDVVIVGAGPVGLTAALELARHGVACVVLDDKDTLNDGSRAICIARHSLEIFQQLGLAQRFTDKALGWTHGTSYYGTRAVYRLEMAHSADERFHPMYNLQQQYVELYLAQAAMANPRVDVRWQNRLVDVAVSSDGAVLTVETPAGRYPLRARHVIAADGARSAVRRSLDLPLKGDAYEGRYVIADIRMVSDYPVERRAYFDAPGNPGSTVLLHRQPDDIWRVDYQLPDGEPEAEALEEASVRRRLERIIANVEGKAQWQLDWWSLYKAYTLALDDYRHGPVLFAGDAAHLVPIFGVRGLNSGLADAMNAAWKLAFVIRGWAPERLLDSYSPERRGATLEIFALAAKSTRFMTPPTRGYRRMRDAALALALRSDLTRPLINPRQSEPYTYSASPLTSHAARDAEFSAGPIAGAPLVNQRLGDDDFLLDRLGVGFSGLYFTRARETPYRVRHLEETLGLGDERFQLIVIRSEQAMRAYGATEDSFYLVRPDRHVAARWRTIDVAEVRGAFALAAGGTTHA